MTRESEGLAKLLASKKVKWDCESARKYEINLRWKNLQRRQNEQNIRKVQDTYVYEYHSYMRDEHSYARQISILGKVAKHFAKSDRERTAKIVCEIKEYLKEKAKCEKQMNFCDEQIQKCEDIMDNYEVIRAKYGIDQDVEFNEIKFEAAG